MEQQILRIRDKIRRGELLSCQLASQEEDEAWQDPAGPYGTNAYGTDELMQTKKSATSMASILKPNENILTPDLVEGRVATIRFQKQHAPGAI